MPMIKNQQMYIFYVMYNGNNELKCKLKFTIFHTLLPCVRI